MVWYASLFSAFKWIQNVLIGPSNYFHSIKDEKYLHFGFLSKKNLIDFSSKVNEIFVNCIEKYKREYVYFWRLNVFVYYDEIGSS